MHHLKIGVFGGTSSGKSSIITRFVDGVFYENCDMLDGDCYWKQILVDDQSTTLEIFDESNSNDLVDLRDEYLKKSDAFVFVFSLVDSSSLTALARIREWVLKIRGTLDVPILLVGNKSDLQSERLICERQCADLVRSLHCCAVIESSARFNKNIQEIFFEITRIALKRKFPVVQKKKKFKSINKCLLM